MYLHISCGSGSPTRRDGSKTRPHTDLLFLALLGMPYTTVMTLVILLGACGYFKLYGR
jgi:hypothetical protein